MSDRSGVVTMKGNPMTLVGNEVNVGDMAPDVELTAVDLSAKRISNYRGKVLIVSTIPSIDTSTCNVQSHRFNEEATAMGDDVAIITVSVDLPFAHKRWCGDLDSVNMDFLSDYKTHEFGTAYGLRVKELGLIARSVTVIDKEGKVVYHSIVEEIADEPNYDAALEAAKAAL
jgi:thiol peroxidase